ncbi:MAG: hypothetical protein RQ735_04680 [Flavobacteriaceae bacterium]|nr:hypothetical protein [Flavobacteriaceae bacterium]
MRRFLHILFLTVFVWGCNDKKQSNTEANYFGGTVINQTSDWVYLYSGETLIDSAFIDSTKSFMFALDNKKTGLFRFVIKPEYQYVFIEPEDSIMVYLNTLEFDESLAFSGRGGAKNNFLSEMFLENEEDSKDIIGYYQLPTESFIHKMDSLRDEKLQKFASFKKETDISEAFSKIAHGSMNFMNYRVRELYPFINTNHLESSFETLPSDYYKFREEIDVDDTLLSSYYSFKNYLMSYLNNISFFKCLADCKNHQHVPKFTYHHNLHKIEMIDSLIKNNQIRDMLLQESAFSFLKNEEDSVNINSYMTVFNKISKSVELDSKVKNMASKTLMLASGKVLPDFEVVDIEGRPFPMSRQFQKNPSVIFFWDSKYRKHFKNAHERIAELQKQFPNINFYGVSVSDNHEDWVAESKRNNLDPKSEFRALNFQKISEDLMINNLSKAYIVNQKGEILNASENFFDPAIERLLAEN